MLLPFEDEETHIAESSSLTAMIGTDVYSDEDYEDLIVYRDQGISTKTYDEEMYGDLLKTESDEEPVVKYNVALCAQDSVSLEKK